MKVSFLKPKFPKFMFVKDNFAKMYKSGQFSNNGPMTQSLESKMKSMFGFSGDVITCANGTISLTVTAKAMRSKRALIPSFTFPATAQALKWAGVEYDFIDISPSDWTMDTNLLESRLKTGEYDLVVPVHSFGAPCDVVTIDKLCSQYGVKVLYDAAPAISSFVKDGDIACHVGNYGDVSSFSLHATKALPAGEGGVIFCKDEVLAKTIREMCNFGLNEDRVPVNEFGLNAKMSDIHACFALSGLDDLSYNQRDRVCLVERYVENLGDLISFQSIRDGDVSTFQVLSACLPEEDSIYRDGILVRMLEKHEIQCRSYYSPALHTVWPSNVSLPVTESVSKRVITLPLHLWMNDSDVDFVCKSFKESYNYFRKDDRRPNATV